MQILAYSISKNVRKNKVEIEVCEMAYVYLSKDKEKAISVAIDVMRTYLNDGFDDYEVNDAIDALVALRDEIKNKREKSRK